MKFFRLNIRAALLIALLTSAAGAQQAPAPQETPPPPSAPRPVSVPKPVERTLANGLRVIVVERHEMPLVTAQLLVKSGGEVDPQGLAGAADMTAELLTKGTKTRTAPQIAQEVEALGGSLESAAGWDASRVTVGVMSSKAPQALAILTDVARNPVFSAEEVERLRQQYLDSLSVAMGDPGQLASMIAPRVVFGDAPYGHPLTGTPDSVRLIKREDIAALHAKFYRPDNAVLVIGGDIRAEEAFGLASRLFGDWAKPPTPLTAAQGSAASQGSARRRVVVVDVPGAGQAAVLVARPGISRTDPMFFSGVVSNAVLSGYSGWLNQEIRINSGLSYGARSSLETRRSVGPFVASAQTKNPSGAEVATLLTGELSRLAGEPVGETELAPRKSVVIGGFGRALETTEGLVGQVASLALYGLPLDELNNYVRNVQSVTAADVQKFAGSRLGTGDASIVIVGDSKEFVEPLRKQFGTVEVIPFAELDLNSATLRKAAPGGAKD